MHSVEEIPQPTYRKLLLEDRFCLVTPLANNFSGAVESHVGNIHSVYNDACASSDKDGEVR